MEIVRLRAEQIAEASGVLARAFQDDPAWSWIAARAPRGARRLLPWLFRLGLRADRGRALDDAAGDDARLRALAAAGPAAACTSAPALRALVATPLRLRAATSRFLAYGRAVDNLRADAVPVPHWYLAGIGVEPAEQRRGIGGALMRAGPRGRRARPASRARCSRTPSGTCRFYERARLRGRARGRDAARRAARLDDGAAGRAGSTRLDSRAMTAEALSRPGRDRGRPRGGRAARARRGGARGAAARRPRARAARDGQARLPRPRRPLRAASSCSAPSNRTGEIDVHLGDIVGVDRHADEVAPRRAVADRRRARAARAASARRCRTRSTASPTSSSATAGATSTC